jgi:hypothetical protein
MKFCEALIRSSHPSLPSGISTLFRGKIQLPSERSLAGRTTFHKLCSTDRHRIPLVLFLILFRLFCANYWRRVPNTKCIARRFLVSLSFTMGGPRREDGRQQQVFLFFISKLSDRWWINNRMNKKKTVMSQWRGASRKRFDFLFFGYIVSSRGVCWSRVNFLASRFVSFSFFFISFKSLIWKWKKIKCLCFGFNSERNSHN